MDVWTASVELKEPLTRTYVGWIHVEGHDDGYTRDKGGAWKRVADEEPADDRQNQVLEFVLMHAIGKRVPWLAGRWGDDGPELL